MENTTSKSSFFSFNSPLKSNLKSASAKTRSLCWQKSVKEENANWKTLERPDPHHPKSSSDLRRHGDSSSCRTMDRCESKSSGVDFLRKRLAKEDTANWQTMDQTERTSAEIYRSRFSKRRSSAPCTVVFDSRSRKPSLKTIQMMKNGSTEVPSPSSSMSYEDNELTEDQRRELRKAFLMFEKGGKNKMAARDLGELLRCLGWNPSERELEEAKHELVVSARGSVSFAEIERYVARRGGICNGCKDEDDIQEAFQVLAQDGDGKISVGKFRHFMTTLGEKMTDDEVEDMISSLNKNKHANFDSIEYSDLIEGLEGTNLDT